MKGRRYDERAEVSGPAARALRLSLSVLQRLLAPFLPFVCEEVWSWWQEGSVHRAAWPLADELFAQAGILGAEGGDGAAAAGGELPGAREELDRQAREDAALAIAADVLREVRKAKSQAQRPMRAPVARVRVTDSAERLTALELARDDLLMAGAIELLESAEGAELSIVVELAQEGS